MKYKCLFSPGKIGSLTVKNRILMAPMSVYLANEDGTMSEELIAFYEARAKGGVGMIFTEYAYVNPEGKSCGRQTSVASDEMIPGLKALADRVHKSGAKIALQLQHGGRRSIVKLTAPSPIPMTQGAPVPHGYSTEEVWQLIDDFVQAGIRAKKAGYDMVEIHCSHGYLLSDFISPRSNRRTDVFGGCMEGRAKVVTEIIKGIKQANGQDYPISIRISGDELTADGHKQRDTAAMALLFEEAGADLMNVSCGVAGVGQGIAPAAKETGHNVEPAREIRQVVDCAVAVAGRITEPVYAEAILRADKVQFVSIGRALLADPNFAQKAAEGCEEDIAPCVGCLQRCYHQFGHGGTQKGCMINPFALRETRLILTPAQQKKKIIIIGAGPAGLEAAWVAAKRGHDVTVYDRNQTAGGQFRTAAIPPHKQPLARAVCYYRRMCEKYGVKLVFGRQVDDQMIRSQHADAVILATGGEPLIPRIPGLVEHVALNNQQVLLGTQLPGKNVLIIGGGLQGAETADHLSHYGYHVTIIEMKNVIAGEDPDAVRNLLLERLTSNGVTMITGALVKEVYSDGVLYEKDGAIFTLNGFDHLIAALGSKAYCPLKEQLADLGDKLYVLGDATRASNAVEAIYRGAELGMSL